MKTPHAVNILRSNYCKLVFFLFLVLSYFIIPKTVFFGYYIIIALSFMVSFSLSMTCIIRNIKDRILLSKTYKTSTIGAAASILGLSAMQVCGVGAPVCGASIGLGILTALFPEIFISFISHYAVGIVVFSIIMQLLSLYFMKCLSLHSKTGCKN